MKPLGDKNDVTDLLLKNRYLNLVWIIEEGFWD